MFKQFRIILVLVCLTALELSSVQAALRLPSFNLISSYGLSLPKSGIVEGGRITRDHLGSIREVTDNSGVVRARYDYDPYGRRTLVSGTDLADFGFTGHYYHQASGLHLALYRAYDANLGRWLSREPLGEIQGDGPNLYVYALSNPINWLDPNGLATVVNNTGTPLYVSGNPGSGHGSNGQVYGVVPSNGKSYGGTNPVPGFSSPQQAMGWHNGTFVGPPVGDICDIDSYSDSDKTNPSGKNKDLLDHKIIGDDKGPQVTVSRNSSGGFSQSSTGVPGAVIRRGREIIHNLFSK